MKKKKYLLGIIFSVFGIVFVSACSSPSTVKADFDKNQYILSLDESVNFFEKLDVKGVDKEKITLTSSNDEIVTTADHKTFKAKSSGHAYIFAKHQDKILAQTKVSVRYKFASPKNIQISHDGVLSWDKSSVVDNGKVVMAENYAVSYGLYNQGEQPQMTTVNVSTNSAPLPADQTGVYLVRVTALALGDMYEASNKTEAQVNYGVMGYLEEVEVNNVLNTANIAWKKKDNAVYDIYLNGFKVKTDHISNFFSQNFASYSASNPIKLEVVAKTTLDDGTIPTTTTIFLRKLQTPNVRYENGKLVWNEVANATGYLLTGGPQGSVNNIGKVTEYALEDGESGVYSINLRAENEDIEKAYLNSDTTKNFVVGKLAKPQYTVAFEGNKAIISFEESENEVKYMISCGEMKAQLLSTETNQEVEISLDGLAVGEHKIVVYASPVEDAAAESGVKSAIIDGQTVEYVMQSNEEIFDFEIMPSLSEFNHSIEQTKSIISFEAIKDGEGNVDGDVVYKLYLNGDVLVVDEYSVQDEEIVFEIENLGQYAPIDDKYSIKIEAYKQADLLQISPIVSKEDSLTILPNTQKADSQANGYYSWEAVDGAKYYYEVYRFEDASKASSTLVSTQETLTTTTEEFGFGYYKIKVYVQSNDQQNRNLNANFHDETIVFEDEFLVNEQIATPEVAFREESGNYILDITMSQNGGEYEIYVDDVLDGKVDLTEAKETITYKMANTFAQGGDYKLKIIAKSGTLYDETLHLPSQAKELNVKRLEEAEYRVELDYDVYGKMTSQLLTIVSQENSIGASVNSVIIPDGGYSLELYDGVKFGTEFNLNLSLVAQDDQPEIDQYYLDSIAKTVAFKRVAAASDLKYNNGILSFANTDANVEKYLIYLTLKNSGLGDYYYTFESSEKSVDLQEKINTLCQSDETFASAYRQMENLKIEVISLQNEMISDVYYLPSLVRADISVEAMEAPIVEFAKETETLSWNEEVEDSLYDIYIDGVLAVEDYQQNSITLSELAGKTDKLDLTNAQVFKVVAKHSAYFDSFYSNEISIEEISITNGVTVTKNGDNYIISIDIDSDSDKIKEVWVNGSAANVDYTPNGTIASFDMADFSGEDEFTIQYISKEETASPYHLNSKIISFSLKELSDITIAVDGENLTWDSTLEGMSGHSINPYLYELTLTNGGNTYTYQTKDTQIKINDIEKLFKNSGNDTSIALNGDFEVKVKAKFNEISYTLTMSEQTTAIGFYGEKESSFTSSSKLASVGDVEIEVVDDQTQSSVIAQKQNAKVTFSFEDKWSSFTAARLYVTIKNGTDSRMIGIPLIPYTGVEYSLSIANGNYTLAVPSSLFTETAVDIELFVSKAGCIDSEMKSLQVLRFEKVDEAEISQDGILTIEDDQDAANYIVSLVIGDERQEQSFTKEEIANGINLQPEGQGNENEWLNGKSAGDYTISILAYDIQNQIIPSQEILTLTRHKYEGLSVEIDEQGRIAITLPPDTYTNAIFTAKTEIDGEDKTIEISPEEGEDYVYTITMIDLVELFKAEDPSFNPAGEQTYKFTVRGEGSINCQWQELSFIYQGEEEGTKPLAKRQDSDKDFIIYPLNQGVETYSIGVKVSMIIYKDVLDENDEPVLDGDGKKLKEPEVVSKMIYYAGEELSALKGYWIESGKKFSKTLLAGESGIECYAISINDILSEYAYGQYTIDVFRVGKNGEKFIQYDKHHFEGYKLNKIEDGSGTGAYIIRNGYNLTWIWNNENQDASLTADVYYVSITNEKSGETSKIKTLLTNLNLMSCGLTPGDEYKISITALSTNSSIVASDESNAVSAIKYVEPFKPAIVDGKLGIDVAAGENDFFADIQSFFAAETVSRYEDIINGKIYNAPFTFTATGMSLLEQRIKVTLTSIDNDNALIVGKKYEIEVPAYDLLLDREILNNRTDVALSQGGNYSYFELLKAYRNSNLNAGNLIAQNGREFIDSLCTSAKGIGTNHLLFDDNGNQIPAGEYSVTFAQLGYNQYVNSDETDAVRIYLSPEPSLTTNQETLDGKDNQYSLTVTPNLTYIPTGTGYEKGMATHYRLRLKKDAAVGLDDGINYEVDFNYSAGVWTAAFNGESFDESAYGKIVYTLDEKNSVVPFKINITAFRHALNALLENKLPVNEEIEVDVYAVSNDEWVINGKSGEITLIYQDIQIAENLKMENGRLLVTNPIDGNLIIRYMYDYSSKVYTQTFAGGVQQIFDMSFISGGKTLDYITLSLEGAYSYNSIKVESDCYGIINAYKLSSPSMKTTSNDLYISYLSQDVSKMSDKISFQISNDSYGKEDYYFTSEFENSSTKLLYRVGANSDFDSETQATEFYSALQGNSGIFTISDTIEDEQKVFCDYILTFSGMIGSETPCDTVIFKSEQSSISARMLDKGCSRATYELNEGDILLSMPLAQSEFKTKDGNEKAGVFYKIDINYYDEGVMTSSKSTTFYTSTLKNEKIFIDGRMIDREYNSYTISATALVGKKLAANLTGSIETIEKEYFSTTDSIIDENGLEVLRSRTTTTGVLSPARAVESVKVADGKITFNVSNGIDAESGEVIILATTANGSQRKIEGTFKQNGQSVTFTPADGQMSDVVGAFKVEIFVFDDGKTLSNPVEISQVYKLPSINGRYSVGINQGYDGTYSTYVDLKPYFDYYSIGGSKSFYNISVIIEYIDGTNEEKYFDIMNTSGNGLSLTLTEKMKTLTVKICDNQASDATNRINLFESDPVKIDIMSTDDSTLMLNWGGDIAGYRFDGLDENTDYEFSYSATIMPTDQTQTTDNGTTQNRFYQPQVMGTLTSLSVRVRKLPQSGVNEIYLFSEGKTVTEGNEFKAFEGGIGTEGNPYLIKTVDQFKNISLRNNKGVYFKLAEDLELNIDSSYNEIAQFNGILVGNGKKLTIKSNKLFDLSLSASAFDGFNNAIEFNSYSSLFKAIGDGAKVENLTIEYSAAIASVTNGRTAAFAPLAAINYGTIANVTTRFTGFDVGYNGTNSFFVAGLTTFNYGNINNCKSENKNNPLNIELNNHSINFIYAGLTIFNETANVGGNNFVGSIFDSFNKASVNISYKTNTNLVVVSGISITNRVASGSGRPSIHACGNDGVLSGSGSSIATVYISGITIVGAGGQIYACYNNQKFTAGSKASSVFSGIVKTLSASSVGGLVDTAGQQLANYCVNVTSIQSNYISASSATTTNLTTSEISRETIIKITRTDLKVLTMFISDIDGDGVFTASVSTT